MLLSKHFIDDETPQKHRLVIKDWLQIKPEKDQNWIAPDFDSLPQLWKSIVPIGDTETLHEQDLRDNHRSTYF